MARNPRGPAKPVDREPAFKDGLLAHVSGGARLLSAKDLKVQQQIAGNHYVGLQIALSFNSEAKRTEIAEVLQGGPAHRAGVLKGDLIDEIDGVTTDGLDVREVVDRLRGLEGTEVTIRVRQAKGGPLRSYKIVRGVLPRQTIEPVRSFGGDRGDTLVAGPGLISYLKIKEIAGSTPRELRQLARTLEDEGAKALVLDLRGMTQAGLHPTILLADDLLDAGVIGRVRSAQRIETYRAEPDALFRDWPLAVIVDSQTTGPAEWLAAALQDNHRAVIVGAQTGAVFGRTGELLDGVETAVPVADSTWFVEMPTGRLERADGRPLASPPVPMGPTTRRRQGYIGNERREGGVTPDVVVALPGPRLILPGVATPDTKPVPVPGGALDPAPAAALQRLREALKLPPIAPRTDAADRVTQRDEVQP